MHINQGRGTRLWNRGINSEVTSTILAPFLGISKLTGMKGRGRDAYRRFSFSHFSSPGAYRIGQPAKQDIHYALMKFVDVHSP